VSEGPPISGKPGQARRRLDVVTMGRAFVDFYGEQIGSSLEDMATFRKYLGGCPANIAVGAARLGLRTAIITRVGDEPMGRFVRRALAAEGIDLSGVAVDPARRTAVAILGIKDRQTYPLVYYRDNCADDALGPDDVDAGLIGDSRTLVVTGTLCSRTSTADACRAAIGHARERGTKVVLDIDYRPGLWPRPAATASEATAAALQPLLAQCDLVVGTEEEIHVVAGTTDTGAALQRLRALTPAVIVMKRGPDGCVIFDAATPQRLEDGIRASAFRVEVLNTFGAGDAFLAGLLRGWLAGDYWQRCAELGNACGAIVVARHGCAPATPHLDEVSRFIDSAKRRPDAVAAVPGAPVRRSPVAGPLMQPLHVLAFDDATPLARLAEEHGCGPGGVSSFIGLVRRSLAQELGGALGLVIDSRHRDALAEATGCGLWLARSADEWIASDAEAGVARAALQLRGWPAEQIVYLRADGLTDDQDDSGSRTRRLRELYEACAATGHELAIDLSRAGPAAMARTMARLYGLGLRPAWWTVGTPMARSEWDFWCGIVRVEDSGCRGLLIRRWPDQERQGAALAVAGIPARGSVVGESFYLDLAAAWFAGRMDEATVGGNLVRRLGGRAGAHVGEHRNPRCEDDG